MRGRDRAGFTLVELLVVVGLLALLTGLLLPVFATAREAARRATCLSNLRQLAQAHRLYVDDYDDLLPGWYFFGGTGGNVYWPEFLHPYYRDSRILDQGFVPASERGASLWRADYALCAWGPYGHGTRSSPYYRYATSMPLAQVRRPGETLLFADGTTAGTVTTIETAHGSGVLNGAFVDGHARRVTDAERSRIDHTEQGYFYHLAASDRE
jgi:prepilin-type N-terminal cleavage/methylation domain-containing protein/prepilin-type processing-associated H-X9-DG protein